ncbi:hypothetical protein B4086_5602 [Bacillus cereus]|nr:hypothetical protein B4086_5602 [Bacillus cereus]
MDIVNFIIGVTKLLSVFAVGVGAFVLISVYLFGVRESLVSLMARAVLFVMLGGTYLLLPSEILQALFTGLQYNSVSVNLVWFLTVVGVAVLGYWLVKRYKEDVEKRVQALQEEKNMLSNE